MATAQRVEREKLRAELAEQRNRTAAARQRARAIKDAGKAIASTQDRMMRRLDRLSAEDGRIREMRDYFDNARRTRVRPGATPVGGAAFMHLPRWDRQQLVAESQNLRRNNWIARILVKRLRDLVFGDGGMWTLSSSDSAYNRAGQRMLEDWADCRKVEKLGHPDIRGRHTFWRLGGQTLQATVTDGDVLIVKRTKPTAGVGGGGGGGYNARRLQLIEGERVQYHGALAGSAFNTGGIHDGVELDRDGEPSAFWVSDWAAGGASPKMDARRVPAEQCIFLTNPVDDEIGLVRGEPALQAQIDRLEFLDMFIENTGLAAEIATRFGIFIKSERPAEMQSAFEATSAATQTGDASRPRQVDLPQASVMFGLPGESIEQIKPEQPTQNFREFALLLLLLCSAEMGIPLPVAFFDGSGLSWAQLQAMMTVAEPGLDVWKDWAITGLCHRVGLWELDGWNQAGMLGMVPADWDELEVSLPGVPVLDFPSAVKGGIEAVNGNVLTRTKLCQRLGVGRFEDILKIRQQEVEAEKAAGVMPVQAPGAVASGAGAPATSDGTDRADGADRSDESDGGDDEDGAEIESKGAAS